jgi:epoxyqueuosine reductase QueG
LKLINQLQHVTTGMGADFFGVADLSPAREAILAQGGPVYAEYPRAISVGIALLTTIVDQLPQRAEPAVALSYRHHCYDLINLRLDQITSRLSSELQGQGYQALPVAASQKVDDERLCGAFSHKLAAHLAGLGWIGKSCMLITPEVGPRVRWATVLTDAPLAITGEAQPERCGQCNLCVEICPVGAYTGQPFRQDEPREARFAAHKCYQYLSEMEETSPARVCGLCLYVCPYGRNGQANRGTGSGQVVRGRVSR